MRSYLKNANGEWESILQGYSGEKLSTDTHKAASSQHQELSDPRGQKTFSQHFRNPVSSAGLAGRVRAIRQSLA